MTTYIIPAAGKATRLRPITTACSKAMVPVNGRPTISYILDRIDPKDEIIIVDGELSDIREFVESRYPHVKFARQHEQKGDLHAAYEGFKISEGKGPVVIWFGDTIVEDNFNPDVDGPLVQAVSDPSLWLMTNGTAFHEKPTKPIGHGYLACVGVYRFKDREKFKVAAQSAFDQGHYNIVGALRSYLDPHVYRYVLQQVTGWYDVGNLETYHETRAKLLKRCSREFNELEVDTFHNVLYKRATNPKHVDKINDEANWYRSLSADQSLFVPRFLGQPKSGELSLTYEPGIPLNELLIWDNLPIFTWKIILNKLFNVMHQVFYLPPIRQPDVDRLNYMWIDKNVARVKEYAPEFIPWIEKVGARCVKNAKWSDVIHGDLHTANIIYEPYTGQIKLIDPRGFFGASGPEGDVHYDIGKLWEDLYWGFTSKLAHQPMARADVTKKLSDLTKDFGYDVWLMQDIGLLLMLTAVPFHADDPKVQEDFIKTARRCISL